MRYRKLSPTGDYTFGHGLLDFYINTPEAVAQAVKTALGLWLGEWFLDTSLGVPYIQGVIGKHSQDTADQTIQQNILLVEGVTNIASFESTLDPVTRKYVVTKCLINTIYGPTTVDLANQTLF